VGHLFLEESAKHRIEKVSARDRSILRVFLDVLWFALRNLSRSISQILCSTWAREPEFTSLRPRAAA